jgi:hypothetical protein
MIVHKILTLPGEIEWDIYLTSVTLSLPASHIAQSSL